MRRSERSERKAKKSKSSYKEKTESRANITPIHPKTASQEALMDSIKDNPITIANGKAGTGKANPNYTPVLTSSGYVPIGDLKVGDYVYSQEGNPTKVLGVYPQGVKDIYQIEFTDGTFAESCKEHLWAVRSPKRTKNNSDYQVLSLGKIMERYSKPKLTKQSYYYEIPLTNPVNFPKIDLPLDPYFLGLLLGDGHFKYTGSCQFTTGEQDFDYFREVLPRVNKVGKYGKVYQLDIIDFKEEIKSLGLEGKTRDSKFIPEIYLFSSVQQRISLLRGLMDSDGSITKNRVRFSNCNKNLVEGLVHLVQSLGGTARVTEERRDKYRLGVCYNVSISLVNINPFLIPRKANKVKVTPMKGPKKIKSIKFLHESEATCIMVDNKDHLYLINDFIVTHNTLVALYEGVKLLDQGSVDQILYCRPVVDFKGERGIGFLPGDVSEKIDPLLAPIKDNITNFLSPGLAEYMMSKGKIKFELLEYIRGRSLRNKFIIADEFQNGTPHSVLTLISRLEESSKLVIMGDSMQRDTVNSGKDGLSDACSRLSGLPQVGIVNFSSKDIVRSSFLSSVINRYDR